MREVLRLPATIDDELRRLWAKNQEIAEHRKESLALVVFAQIIADENFAKFLDER